MESAQTNHIPDNWGCPSSKVIFVPPSPVPDLLYTNHSPCGMEVDLIHTSLSQVHADLSRIDDIAGMQITTDELLHRRQALQKFIDDHNPLLSTVRRLPPEILSHVFVQFLPEDWREELTFCTQTRMVLGQICSFWRQIALSTPRLWAVIGLSLATKDDDGSGAEMANTWLLRSGRCPLSLRIEFSQKSDARNVNTHLTMDAIIPFSSRWRDARFIITPTMLNRLAVVRNTISCLRSLAIDSTLTFDVTYLVENTFECAPELRCVEFGQTSSYWCSLRMPWAQLTKYCAKGLNLRESFMMLAQMPHLIECNIVIRYPQSLHSWFHVHLARLQAFTVDSYVAMGGFFDHLSLPALREFSYVDHQFSGIYGWPAAQFTGFLSRSSCQLYTLRLLAKLTDADLIQCLQCTPSLIKLRLQLQGSRCITTATLSCLTNRGPESGCITCLVPKLQDFVFDHYSTLDASAFTDMIQSRWRSRLDGTPFSRVVRLQSVQIRYGDGFAPAIESGPLGRLRACRDEGLDIYMWRGRKIVEL